MRKACNCTRCTPAYCALVLLNCLVEPYDCAVIAQQCVGYVYESAPAFVNVRVAVDEERCLLPLGLCPASYIRPACHGRRSSRMFAEENKLVSWVGMFRLARIINWSAS